MLIPDRTDECWKSVSWRTETLLSLMETYGFRAHDVAEITSTAEQTVWCWRKSVDRPISALYLKVLMFELNRGIV